MADGQPGASEGDSFFKDAKTLTVSEVALKLHTHLTTMQDRNPEYQPNMLLTKTLEYTRQFIATNKEEMQFKMRE